MVPQFKIIGTRKKRKERKKIRVRDVSDREVSAVIEPGIKPKVTKKDIHIILRFLIPSPSKLKMYTVKNGYCTAKCRPYIFFIISDCHNIEFLLS